jgi:hypothetical protein
MKPLVKGIKEEKDGEMEGDGTTSVKCLIWTWRRPSKR